VTWFWRNFQWIKDEQLKTSALDHAVTSSTVDRA